MDNFDVHRKRVKSYPARVSRVDYFPYLSWRCLVQLCVVYFNCEKPARSTVVAIESGLEVANGWHHTRG